jgi:hypothetical protein
MPESKIVPTKPAGCVSCMVKAHECGCCGAAVGHDDAVCRHCANVIYKILLAADRRVLR